MDAAFPLLEQLRYHLQRLQVHRPVCCSLWERCSSILAMLQEADTKLHPLGSLDGLAAVSQPVEQWTSLGRVQEFLRRDEIARGLKDITRELETGFTEVLTRRVPKERERVHLRALLLTIITNKDDWRNILALQPHDIEDIMEQIQHQIVTGLIVTSQHELFLDGLWRLYSESNVLPPRVDMSREVDPFENIQPAGKLPDIFYGRWLAQEAVTFKMVGKLTVENSRKQLEREIKRWRRLIDPHVARLYGFVYRQEHIYTVSPRVHGTSSLHYLQQNRHADRLKLLAEAASGVEYLHEQGIVHGELRAANIIVSETGSPCIVNFGISKFLEEIGHQRGAGADADPDASLHNNITVPEDYVRWQAIEIINPKIVGGSSAVSTTKSDVWSFGMCALEVLTGLRPFPHLQDPAQVVEALLHHERPAKPTDSAEFSLSDVLWHFLLQCWLDDPDLRPTMANVAFSFQQRDPDLLGSLSPSRLTRPPRLLDVQPILVTTNLPRFSIASSPHSPSLSLPHTPEFHPSPLSPPFGGLFSSASPTVSDSEVGLSPTARSQPTEVHERGRENGRRSTFTLSWNKPFNTFRSRSPPQPAGHLKDRTSFSQVDLPSPVESPPLSPSSPIQSSPQVRDNANDTSIALGLHHMDTVNNDHLNIRAQSPRTSPGRRSNSINHGSPQRDQWSNEPSPTSPPLMEEVSLESADLCVSKDGSVLSGTTLGFIERLITDRGSTHELFQDVFLQTYRVFTSAADIVDLMIERFNTPCIPREKWMATRRSILTFLTTWLERYPTERPEPPILAKLSEFAQCVQGPPTLVASAMALFWEVTRALQPPHPPSPTGTSLPRPQDIVPSVVARQLTVIQNDYLQKILPADLIMVVKELDERNRVTPFNIFNNLLASWVTRTVLFLQEPSAEKRAKGLKFLISVANECRLLRDFSSMAAITVAVDSIAISRLEYTMRCLDTTSHQRLAEMKKLLNPSRNFHAYRTELKSSQKPWIPFLMVHIMDLKAFYARCQRNTKVGMLMHVDFASHKQLLEHIQVALPLTENKYELEGHPRVLPWIRNLIQRVSLTKAFQDELEARSLKACADEKRDYFTRVVEHDLDRSGFY